MSDTYAKRRMRLIKEMGKGIAVIPNAPERRRNGDADYPYRFDSSFHYLTGFSEPESVLVVVSGDAPRSILFCREKDMEREIWDGFRFGPEAAREHFGFDATHPVSSLEQELALLMENQETVFYPMGADAEWDQRMLKLRETVQRKVRSGIKAPDEMRDVRTLVNEMRLFKDAHEIALMRKAAAISASAHRRAMRFAREGAFEYEVEAELLHEFCRQGARHPAYTSIVAAGANACVLHYISNDAKLKKSDLLLIDAGCEYRGYASDITRTFPVSGKFSGAKKDVYEIVLAAQLEAIKAAIPGNSWDAPHQAALRVLVQGFIDLKLCKGTVDGVLEDESYKKYYMHRTGHWLGMDVHDVGSYKSNEEWRRLEPGMVLTVEPGCYIRASEGVPRALWNIGIRIEDDVAITRNGHEVLTDGAPKTVHDIEELMRKP